MSYCTAIGSMKEGDRELHRAYHDHQYGFPLHEDDELFCRLILEINQAGLSWTTILRKQVSFRAAYDNFEIDKVAAYGAADVERLMNDAGIIRNRLKVQAAIENARTIQKLQKQYGSFKAWLDHHHPLPKEEWVKLFKATFRFTGGEIVNEFLMSTGYLPGAHDADCSIQKRVLASKPPWTKKKKG